MKKIVVLIAAICIASCSSASLPSHNGYPSNNAANIMISVGKEGKKISLLKLSVISRKDLEEFTGKKMSFTERIAFHLTQNKLRKGIDGQGTLTDRKLREIFSADKQKGFHAGGFFLGLLLGPIGLLIAYLIKDDKKRNRVKWTWIGFGIWLVILVLTAVALNSLFTF